MGEVYRATDATLRRDVALKVLPDALAEDRSRYLRFEQEARATAALHHPNVVVIHDFGTAGSTPYLVTELLDGETLADVLSRGPVPMRRALAWSVQILRGIAAAHARGIVHRDLKPGNLFILHDGSVKILDFGLAKVTLDAISGTDAPTARISDSGAVLGTVGYMAPEQIRGTIADARSDIFSFAVVLYEMLIGRSPFARATAAETLSAILRDDPPRLDTPPYPAVLASTLQQCLEKSPEERFHSAHDLALHLEMIELNPSGPVPMIGASRPPEIEQVTFRRGRIYNARFAPDGSMVYGAAWSGRPLELYVTHHGIPEARSLGIGASIHAITRNGELAVSIGRTTEVGFQHFGTLARVGLTGGAPRPIANAVYEADWSPDGKQLAICRRSERGFQIEYPIGRPIYESSSWISDMRIAPSGREIAFLEHPYGGDNFGYVTVVDMNGKAEQLTGALYIAWGLAWHPISGEIWYTAAPTGLERSSSILLYAVSRGSEPREVFASLGAITLHDIAPDGTVMLTQESMRRNIVGRREGDDEDQELSWFDWSFPTGLSADGSTLLFEEQGVASRGKYAFFLRPTDGGPAVRLDEGRGHDLSRDGEYVLTMTTTKPERLLLVPTGAGETREVPVTGIDHFMTARFLPGEREVALLGSRKGEGIRLWTVPVTGGEARACSEPVISDSFFWAVSPDGTRVAVVSGQRTLLYSLSGDAEPEPLRGAEPGEVPVRWGKDDTLLLFRRGERQGDVTAVNLVSGERRFVQSVRPPDGTGVDGIYPVRYAESNDSYVFGYRLMLSSLFLVRGLR